MWNHSIRKKRGNSVSAVRGSNSDHCQREGMRSRPSPQAAELLIMKARQMAPRRPGRIEREACSSGVQSVWTKGELAIARHRTFRLFINPKSAREQETPRTIGRSGEKAKRRDIEPPSLPPNSSPSAPPVNIPYIHTYTHATPVRTSLKASLPFTHTQKSWHPSSSQSSPE